MPRKPFNEYTLRDWAKAGLISLALVLWLGLCLYLAPTMVVHP